MPDDMHDEPAPRCGFTSEEVRRFLCRIGDEIWYKFEFSVRLRVPPRTGIALAAALVDQGYLERTTGWRADKGRPAGFQLTLIGRRATGRRQLQPISRRSAAALIAKVSARVEKVNRRTDLMHRIVEAHVLGSWCWGEDEVAVVDIAVRVALRPDLARRMKKELARDDAVGRLRGQWLRNDLAEVLTSVKRRTPHLRVYDYRNASRLGPWRECIYPPPGARESAPADVTHSRARRMVGRLKRGRGANVKQRRRTR